MPQVHNGIGTWYYGKTRIHRLNGECEFCHRVGELASYDTTLYFVFFFIPLFPLGRKRVLQECPTCQRHRVASLKEWERSKEEAVTGALQKLSENPEDREATLAALAIATGFQDEALFDKLAGALAGHLQDDAAVQAQLGSAYAYFARREESVAAYRASLAAEDDPEVRRWLALNLLKLGRPDEARPLLRHVLDDKLTDNAGMLYLLAEAYQAEGRHQEALDVMNQRDQAFPDLATTPEWVQQRQTSDRHLDSGKKVKSLYLAESARAGYQEGGRLANLPRLVGPALLLGLVALYLGTALWRGQSRAIHLVNGTGRAYTVLVNGREATVPAAGVAPLRIAEGEVRVEPRDAAGGVEAFTTRVETSFFKRPFTSPTFVVNPDRLAVVVREQMVYSETPREPTEPDQFYTGDVLYTFTGLDLEFAPFPQSIKAKAGSITYKTRVDLVRGLPAISRLQQVANLLDEGGQVAYAKRFLRHEPTDLYFLGWLLSKLPEAEATAFLKTRLGDKPPLVEWHRFYQNFAEKSGREAELIPEYRKLVADSQSHPDARYLLGRLLDGDESDRLMKQAAEASPPSVHAQGSLAFRALAQGRFDDAVRWSEKAAVLGSDHPQFRETRRMALFAAKQYDQLLNEAAGPGQDLENLLANSLDRVRALVAKGDEAGARAAVDQTLNAIPPGAQLDPLRQVLRGSLEAAAAVTRGNAQEFLKVAQQMPESSAVGVALLQGKPLAEVAAAVDPKSDDVAAQHALLFLAARKAKDARLTEEQHQALLTALTTMTREHRHLKEMLAGRQPIQADAVRRLIVDPRHKRVLVAALAFRAPPPQRQELLQLASELDFQRDVTSLSLRQVLDKQP